MKRRTKLIGHVLKYDSVINRMYYPGNEGYKYDAYQELKKQAKQRRVERLLTRKNGNKTRLNHTV